MKKLAALLIVAILSTSLAAAYFYRPFEPRITLHPWPNDARMAFVITCDDVSAGYPLTYFTDIESVIESHNFRATFFVIPYHGEWDLLTRSPQFVDALHSAEKKGNEIALHGYAHYPDEFLSSLPEQEETLKKALAIMHEAGFVMKGFRAPEFKSTPETLSLLKKYNFLYDSSVFSSSGEVSLEGELPQVPSGHEYTWYIDEKECAGNVTLAKIECESKYRSGGVFALVVHMKAVNEGEGIRFLSEFLSYMAEKEMWNPTLRELVEWELQMKKVTWENRKTLTGGEITFYNVPKGLVVDIDLPSHYDMEAPDAAVAVEGNTLTFEESYEEVTIPFVIRYRDTEMTNELEIFTSPSSDSLALEKVLNAWEVPYRLESDAEISTNTVGDASLLLVDRAFLDRSLTAQKNVLLYSLRGRVIVFSGFNYLQFPFLPPSLETIDYVTSPLEPGSSSCYGGRNMGYCRVRVFKGRSTCIYFEPLNDCPRELYYNLLLRSLFASSTLPIRKPVFTLEIDDCGMYKDKYGNETGIEAYENSLDLARAVNVTPTYGFTTSYFDRNPQIDAIFSLLKTHDVLVANHGYTHALDFLNPKELARDIQQANADLEKKWKEPAIVLIPANEMCQQSVADALKDTQFIVGSQDKGYVFGVFNTVFFYERKGLQLPSQSGEDAPPFLSLFLYSTYFPPSFYVVTHIFNYVEKGSAHQHINDCLQYLVRIGYEPSNTVAMAEEDFFWSCVDMESHVKGGRLTIHLSGVEDPPREYIVHIMLCRGGNVTVDADPYTVTPFVYHTADITFVTLVLQPGRHTRR